MMTSVTKENTKSKLVVAESKFIQVKKLDAPTFGGDLMDYASFMSDYEIHMKPV